VADQREGDADQVLAGARPLQHGAEEDEREDERGGDAEGDPEEPLRRQVELADDAPHAVAAVGEQLGHPWPHEGVGEEGHRDAGQPQADRAPRALQDEEDEQGAHRDVRSRGRAHPVDQRREVDGDVERRVGAEDGQDQVVPGHPAVAGALDGRVEHEAQHDRERQVHGALDHAGERAHRRRPELEGRHPQRDGSGQP
jgi:hypothetical protein